MASGETSVGAIAVEILARTEKLEQGLDKAAGNISKFGGMIAGATAAVTQFALQMGTAAVNAFIEYGAATMQAVDSTAKLSDQLGVSFEALRGLQHGGSLAGSSAEQVGDAFKKLAKQLGEVRSGNLETSKTFRELGLDGLKLSEMPLDKAFGRIAQKISEIQNPTDRAKAAMDVFGKSGQDLLPMMAQGEEGLRKMQQEFQSLGGNMNRLDAAKIENVNDAFDRLKVQVGNSASKLVANFSDELQSAAGWLGNLATTAESVFGHVANGIKTIMSEWSAWDTAINGVDASMRRMTQNAVADLDAAWTKMKGTLKQMQEEEDGWWLKPREDEFGGKLKPYEQEMADKLNREAAAGLKKEAEAAKKIQDDLANNYKQNLETASRELSNKAASWIEATKSPMDRWVDQMKEINMLRLEGKLTDIEARNAAYKAVETLENATLPKVNLQPVGFAGQLSANGVSAEALRMSTRKTVVEDPQLKVTNALLTDMNKNIKRIGMGGTAVTS
jgi:hypothetical protein